MSRGSKKCGRTFLNGKMFLIEGSIPEPYPRFGEEDRLSASRYELFDARDRTIEFVWERLVPGAVVLLDDYAYYGYFSQKSAMISLPGKRDQNLVVPTGQGLVMKPLDAH